MYKVKAQDINDEIAKSKAEFDQWKESQSRAMDDLKQNNESMIHENKENIRRLEAQRADLQDREKQLSKVLEAENQQVKECEEEVKAMREKVGAAAAAKTAMEKHVEAESHHVKQEVLAVGEAEQLRNAKMDELTKGVGFYKERLGLRFERVDTDKLRFVFWNIDPVKFDREFYFAVCIDDSNTYRLVECNPKVSGTAPLVEKLNATNDFSVFARTMRKKFKECCNA